MLEYWEPEEPFDLPKNVNFEYKAETDLYDFKKVSKMRMVFMGNVSAHLLIFVYLVQVSANIHRVVERWLEVCYHEYARQTSSHIQIFEWQSLPQV
jgi:hypothetical protein